MSPMENAHLRLGKLRLIKQTRDTITEVTVHLERLIADVPPERSETAFHLVSVFGGDQEIGAVIAAAQEGLRFQVEWQGRQIMGTLGDKPTVFRASLQIPGRKRPVRHAILISTALAETTFGANAEARRTILYDGAPEFVLHRLSVRFGLPVLPEWAGWFRTELDNRELIEPLLGINCHAVAVKGTKLRLLRILSQGLRR
ncbi:MAG: hypothetical protein K2Q23_07000, partial [Bryobacteraceae bacterium]|nr:hypothetical protein [Bryobacteraceae bacterium]